MARKYSRCAQRKVKKVMRTEEIFYGERSAAARQVVAA
jgi:hypothetical protein